ncbi:hypothetical protein ACIQAL_09955 [Pseudomonas sp. NPDC088368]|jgi:hypothetical protein|uniref:hypothetical protein n=1 Tax=Pseudomonas sp. NPDC088368 TaxID=3364453 RepID=UPI0038101F7F
MTDPMLFGICMTIQYLLLFKLRLRVLRKSVGLTLTGVAVAAFFRVPVMDEVPFIVMLTLMTSGLGLLFGRDYSDKQEGKS